MWKELKKSGLRDMMRQVILELPHEWQKISEEIILWILIRKSQKSWV